MGEAAPVWGKSKDQVQWTVLVDGSSVSGKAFDAAVSFLCYHNGKGIKDDLAVVHSYDPRMDADKPTYMRGPNILNAYDTLLIRARRQYDSAGPHRLRARFLAAEYKTTDELQEVAKLEYTQGNATTEEAPAVVAAMLKTLNASVHPDFLFMGSFGTGGKKVGEVGSVTDYMLRLSNSTLVIIKHWRPIPKLGEPSIFVVAIDDSPASMRALEQVLYVAKPTDSITCVTVSHHHGTKDDALIAKADDMLAKHHGDVSATSRAKYYQMAKEGETAAEVILRAAEELEADYLCLGSFNTAHGAHSRSSMSAMGSTALYCSQQAKCHAIVVKPPRDKPLSRPASAEPPA